MTLMPGILRESSARQKDSTIPSAATTANFAAAGSATALIRF